jgi:purine-nucleoside phosphorylase
MNEHEKKVIESVNFLRSWYGETPPEIAVVLGSGLSQAIPRIEDMKGVSYSKIPGFKQTHVEGHAGDLRIGKVEADGKSRDIAFLRGRVHGYEGHTAAEVVHPLRSLIRWGVKGVLLTNAAGCLHKGFSLGKMMVITDHINGTGMSPLTGEFGAPFGARFVDMSCPYDKEWQQILVGCAQNLGQEIYQGVYYGVQGPQYETPAEIRMMRQLGASAVGMSTVLETIAARQMGAKVAGLSCLTNYGSGLDGVPLDHADVMSMGARFAQQMADIVLRSLVAFTV